MHSGPALTALVAVVGSISACGIGEAPITEATVCRDFLARPGGEQSDAAARISAEIDGVSNPGNPMWALSLASACGKHPDMTIGEYFRP